MHVFFFGMGYSSLAAARAIHAMAATIPIVGTTRSEETIEAFADSPYRLHVFNGTQRSETLATDLRQATHVILSIPPDETGDPAYMLHRADLDAATNLQWLCYYSTVGVYGDFNGEWIDESAVLHPTNKRSLQRVAAEELWRKYAMARDLPLLILRLSGIYGPGRSAFEKLRDGTARRIVKPGQVFNRIHVADIGRVTELAAFRKLSGTFNLTDDEPAPPQDLVAHAAHMIDVQPPDEIAFEDAQMTPMARSFYSDNKRVSNAAIKSALSIELLHPTYREGLNAILLGTT